MCSVAKLVHHVFSNADSRTPCSTLFWRYTLFIKIYKSELLEGKYALGTVIPKHALDDLDEAIIFTYYETKQYGKICSFRLAWIGIKQTKSPYLP